MDMFNTGYYNDKFAPLPSKQDNTELEIIGRVAKCHKLNLREKPSFTAKIIDVLNENAKVKIIHDDPKSDFYKVVTYNGHTGYVCKRYVVVTNR